MDLTDYARAEMQEDVADMVAWLRAGDQSLGIAREAMIEMFDKAASGG